MAGFIAMLSVFLVVTVEMFFAMQGAKHIHGKEYDDFIGEISTGGNSVRFAEGDRTEYVHLTAQDSDPVLPHQVRSDATEDSDSLEVNGPDAQPVPHGAGSRLSEGPNFGKDDDDDEDLDLEELDPYTDEESSGQPHSRSAQRPHTGIHRRNAANSHHRQDSDTIVLQNPQRQLLQCLLLEAGILFHSIFIGMALSVATGTSFVVLLVAISFHQTFEGFALGSRIASLIPDLFPPSSPKPWLMACAYGTTTPIGQALGLVLHNLYDPGSSMSLLMVGITNAISSGLLLFAGLVELLAEDFLSDSSYETLKGRRRVEACVAVASGAILMAFVGAFA
jgi:zinc transporter ZupT